jgi:hypothetical protein
LGDQNVEKYQPDFRNFDVGRKDTARGSFEISR